MNAGKNIGSGQVVSVWLRRTQLLVLSLLTPGLLLSQNKFSDNLKFSGNYHCGVNIPEYSFFTYISDSYVQSADLCLIKETSGKNLWEDLYNYPEHGLSVFFTTLGNNKIFGQELSCNYFFKLNFIYTARFRLYSRFGTGMGYVNRTFDAQSNYLNVAIGSHFNIHFNARVGAEWKVSKRFDAGFGVSFDHLSNANSTPVNLGINSATLFAGMSCVLGQRTEKISVYREKHVPENAMEVVSLLGGKVIRNSSIGSKYFGVLGLSLEMRRSFFRGVHFGFGADVSYDTSIETARLSEGKTYRPYQSWQTGIHLSQSFVYNRFSVTIQEGFYVGLQNTIYHKAMYNRGIIKYQVSDHFSVRLTMRSHLHILDFPEIGFGYLF